MLEKLKNITGVSIENLKEFRYAVYMFIISLIYAVMHFIFAHDILYTNKYMCCIFTNEQRLQIDIITVISFIIGLIISFILEVIYRKNNPNRKKLIKLNYFLDGGVRLLAYMFITMFIVAKFDHNPLSTVLLWIVIFITVCEIVVYIIKRFKKKNNSYKKETVILKDIDDIKITEFTRKSTLAGKRSPRKNVKKYLKKGIKPLRLYNGFLIATETEYYIYKKILQIKNVPVFEVQKEDLTTKELNKLKNGFFGKDE